MNPLALLGLLRRIPPAAWVVLALLAWGGWNRFEARHQRAAAQRAEASAKLQAQAATGERDARKIERRDALAAKERADALDQERRRAAAAASAARSELGRLRVALAAGSAARPASAASAAAGRPDGSDPARVVVGECAEQLATVAEAADACGARLNGLQAWVRDALRTVSDQQGGRDANDP